MVGVYNKDEFKQAIKNASIELVKSEINKLVKSAAEKTSFFSKRGPDETISVSYFVVWVDWPWYCHRRSTNMNQLPPQWNLFKNKLFNKQIRLLEALHSDKEVSNIDANEYSNESEYPVYTRNRVNREIGINSSMDYFTSSTYDKYGIF